jgi:choline dehydrogenase-like flavoprotein
MRSSQKSKLPRVCIVGSGPGATVVALELALSGKAHVIVVDLDKCSDSYSQIKSPALKADIVGHPFGQEVTRAFGFGGSSNLWHGVLAKLDPEDWTKFDESAGCEVSKEILDCYKNLDAYFPRLAEVFKSKNPIAIHRNFVYYGMGGPKYDYTIYTKDEAILQLTQSLNKLSEE